MKTSAMPIPESRRNFLKKLAVGTLLLDVAGARTFVPVQAGIRAALPSSSEKAIEETSGDYWDSLGDPGWGP